MSEVQTITLANGRRMSFRAMGSGPVLVQIHGIGTGHRNFDLLSPLLASSFRVVDVDLPGYGESDPTVGERGIDALAEAVREFIIEHEGAPVLLHGTSFGGLVAMTLAAKSGADVVAKLAVTCAFGRLDNAMRSMQRSWESAAMVGPEMLAEVTSVQGFSRAFWDRQDAGEVRHAFFQAMKTSSTEDFVRDLPLMAKVDLESLVPAIRQPTLLLGADEDQMTPITTSASGIGMTDLARLIPNAQLEVLDGCGHFITIERADDTAAALMRFFLGPRGEA